MKNEFIVNDWKILPIDNKKKNIPQIQTTFLISELNLSLRNELCSK